MKVFLRVDWMFKSPKNFDDNIWTSWPKSTNKKRASLTFFLKGQADTHYRGKRHARITEIRRRKSQKIESSKLDSDGNQTATESSGHFSESDNLNQGELNNMTGETTNTVVGSSVDPTMVKDTKNEVS